ncbi:MAG: VPLPA-CTERM sorting domain-containing protein [Halioglobus sp.]
MKIVNIKSYLGTLAAAVTLSVASLGAQAAAIEYNWIGTVTSNNGAGLLPVDVGGSLGGFFLADDGGDGTIADGDIDNTLNYAGSPYCSNNPGSCSASRFALFNLNSTPAFPAIKDGSASGSSLTTDALGNITGGGVSIVAKVPTGTAGTLNIDADAGTWAFVIFGNDIAQGTGSFVAPSAVPVPAAAWLFGSALVGLVGVGRRRKLAA